MIACPVCGDPCTPLGAVDFNKSCDDAWNHTVPAAGHPVQYFRCGGCGFCFAPEFAGWPLAKFEERIYNRDYVQVDPDYADARPRRNAAHLITMLGDAGRSITHLDYGGGDGLLSRILRENGWQSQSYDPLADRDQNTGTLGCFDFITAFEVFEHVPDVNGLAADLARLAKPDGIVFFTTLTTDGEVRPGEPFDWWYAAPRNGHISLFSRHSLAVLGARHGFYCGSFSEGVHAYWRAIPGWAAHLIRPE